MSKRSVFRVGISGSYGGWNLGDEAILQGIIGELRRALPVEITVFSRDPDDTLRRHGVERAVAVREFCRDEILPEIARLDLFILGGGGILFDAGAQTYLREVELAHALGIPVMVYAVSAGPLANPEAQALVRACLDEAEVLTVRDRRAKHLLERCGVRNEIRVTADPALLIEPEPLPEHALACEGLDRGRRLVGVSVREKGPAAPDLDERAYHELLANTADYIVDRLDADVVLVPMERRRLDLQHCHAVLSRMRRVQRASVLRGDYSAGQLLSLVGHFEFAVGMRLHFLIFAALQRVPFVALPYASKVTGFVEELGLAAPPASGTSAGELIAHVDRTWDGRAAVKEHVAQAIPRLQAKAREGARLAERLLLARRRPTPPTGSELPIAVSAA